MPTVEIDEEKYEILSQRAEKKGFDSTEDYIDDILDQIVKKIQKEEDETTEEVKQKLKDLGYTS